MSSNDGGKEISHQGDAMRKAEALEVTVVRDSLNLAYISSSEFELV